MSTAVKPPGEGTVTRSRPTRLTPLYHKHISLGAKMTEWESWVVPESYRAPSKEAEDALKSVGLAEESASTKIDIKGTEIDSFASEVLRMRAPKRPGEVFTHPADGRWGGAAVRHLCRLARDHAFVVLDGSINLSTRSPIAVDGPGAPSLRVYTTNVSSVLAGVTLIGPMSWSVLRKLSDLKMSSVATPSSVCAEGPVAGIQSLMIRSAARLGDGRLDSTELYFGRDSAEYMWDALTDAGREFGMTPIGTKALISIRGRISRPPGPGEGRE